MNDLLLQQVDSMLDSILNLDPATKNALYHDILLTIKSNEPTAAATLIIGKFQNLLFSMRATVSEDTSDKLEGKISPIFRRVG